MKNTITTGCVRLLLAVLAIALVGQGQTSGQSYSSGQNISPAYEGWEKNADGSFSFLFGYMNRNWEEEIDVPVGADNYFEPGTPDQGQPTHFLPRRNRFMFRVRVPADWGEKELIWTLTTHGKTEKAYATLRTDYLVDHVVIASETGALGAGTSSPESRSNKSPVITLESPTKVSARVGQPITLTALVSDDGLPKSRRRELAARARARSRDPEDQPQEPRPNPAYRPPSRITVGKTTGLFLSWFVYRGEGNVTIDPPQVKVWEDTRAGANSPWAPLWVPPAAPPDGKWVARATFDQLGTYVLRARADDGAAFDDEEVTVIVTP